MGRVGRAVGIVLLLSVAGIGCGGEDNDQGISFRGVGLFQGEVQEGMCTVPTTSEAIVDAGIAIPLDGAVAGTDVLASGFPASDTFFSICRAYILMANDLRNQSINIERFDFVYEIPGAQISIPSNSMPTGFRLSPTNANPDTTGNSSGQLNSLFIQPDGQMIPTTLVQFLRQNEPSLPPLPYVMIIHITAVGRTDSGDVLVSNELRYTVEWTN